MDSITGSLTGFFNLSAAFSWDMHRPDNPVDAFAHSLELTGLFANGLSAEMLGLRR